ncbi:P-loop containing nucleoside triphosphate hydrolase protein [Xylariaceae sp. FL1651]|nr:P-loop containing nucleoside triphosphate hydrolase protein [Xylariaceae sp. FL1651]
MTRSDDFEIVSQIQPPQDSSLYGKNAGDKKDIDGTPNQLKCQLKEYEARYDRDGKRTVKEVELDQDADLKDEGKFAMRYYKYYNKENKIEKVDLEIGSPHIRDALSSIIVSYPGQSLTGNITLTGNTEWSTLSCLFHYRKELKRHRESLESPSAQRHVSLLIEFFERELRRNIQRFETNIQAETPCVEFKDLWMLFKPGDLMFGGESCCQFINQVVKVAFNMGNPSIPPKWTITSHALTHNGSMYGYISRTHELCSFEGIAAVATLPFHPVKFHPNQYALQKYLIYRGRKFCSLTGVQYKAYSGSAIAVDKLRTVSFSGKASNTYPQEDVQIDGRIMIDSKAFVDERTDTDIKFSKVNDCETIDLTDDDFMMCHFAVPGFSLSEKRWCWFYVDFVTEIVFDDGAFDALLLPTKQKRLIRALTTKHTSGKDSFDDLIQGKGQGCIFLLHGEPGIGKTFTAEGIADDIRRPLYVMMSGELGSDVKTVDDRLRGVLKLATKWNAVLLIDEADVFLEKRSSHDLARNSLVSIFLRTLEYFSGVLFLTTNRINSFDLAFQSRIHLALKYRGLDANSREKLWRLFLKKTSDFKDEDWPQEVMKELAAAKINGRQIKNTVRTAHALALAEKEKLSIEQIRDVLETVSEFQADFNRETQAHASLAVEPAILNAMDDLTQPRMPEMEL